MKRMLLLSLACLLVSSCSPFEERQKRAYEFLDEAQDRLTTGIEKAKEIQDNVVTAFSGATDTIQATAIKVDKTMDAIGDLSDSFQQLSNSVSDTTEAVQSVSKGVGELGKIVGE